MEFIDELMQAFQGKLDTQVLPENVLVHSDRRTVWWMPPAIWAMFYVGTGRRNSISCRASGTRSRFASFIVRPR
jgi:hypothetical protein